MMAQCSDLKPYDGRASFPDMSFECYRLRSKHQRLINEPLRTSLGLVAALAPREHVGGVRYHDLSWVGEQTGREYAGEA